MALLGLEFHTATELAPRHIEQIQRTRGGRDMERGVLAHDVAEQGRPRPRQRRLKGDAGRHGARRAGAGAIVAGVSFAQSAVQRLQQVSIALASIQGGPFNIKVISI